MKKGFVYTVAFMVILSALLTFALAFSYEAFKPSIATHKQLAEERAVLYAFGLEADLADNDVHALFEKLITPGGLDGKTGYTYHEAGEVKGYAIPFAGPGLWGTIRGFLGVGAALDQATGLVFTQQNETPGLGGRIDESQYKEQFRGLPIKAGTELVYGAQGDHQIDTITGATQTSSAVLRILNKVIAEVMHTGEGK
jgi:Na+-transporting NADH:ubiquinone oxidoreductase subunit C